MVFNVSGNLKTDDEDLKHEFVDLELEDPKDLQITRERSSKPKTRCLVVSWVFVGVSVLLIGAVANWGFIQRNKLQEVLEQQNTIDDASIGELQEEKTTAKNDIVPQFIPSLIRFVIKVSKTDTLNDVADTAVDDANKDATQEKPKRPCEPIFLKNGQSFQGKFVPEIDENGFLKNAGTVILLPPIVKNRVFLQS